MLILLLKKIRNLEKAFCLVLILSLLSIVHLYIQEKDFRITYLQNEVRYVTYVEERINDFDVSGASTC